MLLLIVNQKNLLIIDFLAKLKMKKIATITIAIIVGSFCVINFLLSPNQLNYINSSTIGGLAMMKQLATETISYQDAIVNNRPTLVEFSVE